MPELNSLMCLYIVLHIEVQSRDLKRGRKKKMLWMHIRCIFSERGEDTKR